MLDERDRVDEDEHQCKYCTDLCYLSMAFCVDHVKRPGEEDEESEDEKKDSSEAPASKYERRKQRLQASSDSDYFCICHMDICNCDWS